MSKDNTIPFIDWHCDTLMQAWFRHKKDIYHFPHAMLDVQRLQKGGASAQFFAIFLQSMSMKRALGPLMIKDEVYIQKLMNTFYRTLERHSDVIAFAGNAADMEKNRSEGKTSAFLTIEDGRAVNGRMETLEEYYRRGVRLLTLTWNFQNCFGYPNSANVVDMKKGLSEFGKEAIGEMNRLGIIIDVSHLSDGGFWDVASLSKKPFVASHSNARALCPHPRNLTDEMIRKIGETGGIIGINHAPDFLYYGSKESRIEDLVAHILHIRKVGGIECVALGSDFDGIKGRLCLSGPQEYQRLAQELLKAGLTETEVEDIFFRNSERVIRDVM